MIPLPHKAKQKINSPLQLQQTQPAGRQTNYRLSLQNTHTHTQQHPSYMPTNTAKQLDMGGQVVNKKYFDFDRIERSTRDIITRQQTQSEPITKYYSQKSQRPKQPKSTSNRDEPQSPLLKIMQSSSEYAFQDSHKNGRKQLNQAEYVRVLEQKQQQIRMLTLELQRYRRCEQINKQNEQIYRKLVGMLNQQKEQIKLQAEVYESRRLQNETQSKKAKEISVSETTRFMYPETVRNELAADSKNINNFATPIRIAQEIQSKYCFEQHHNEGSASRYKNETVQYLPIRKQQQDEEDSKTMTFNINKEANQHKKPHHMHYKPNPNHKHPFYIAKPPISTAKFGELPIEHKLSAINRSLWNKRQEQTQLRRLQKSNLCSSALLWEHGGSNKRRVSSISDNSLLKLHF